MKLCIIPRDIEKLQNLQPRVNDGVRMRSLEVLSERAGAAARSGAEAAADAAQEDSGGELAEEVDADARRRQAEGPRGAVGRFSVEELRDRTGVRALGGGDTESDVEQGGGRDQRRAGGRRAGHAREKRHGDDGAADAAAGGAGAAGSSVELLRHISRLRLSECDE